MEQNEYNLMEKIEEKKCHICGSKMRRVIVDDGERTITYECHCGASQKLFYK